MHLTVIGLFMISLPTLMSFGNIPDISIQPKESGFLLQSITRENGIYKQDVLLKEPVTHTKIISTFGSLKSESPLTAALNVDSSISSKDFNMDDLSGHLVTREVKEDDPRLHFLCHIAQYKSGFAKSFHDTSQFFSNKNNQYSSSSFNYCCAFSIITSLSSQRVGCKLNPSKGPICHTSAVLSKSLWNSQPLGLVNVSYIIKPLSDTVVDDDDDGCLKMNYNSNHFSSLESPKLKRISADKEYEISRTLLVQVPTRELKIDELFKIPLKLKNATNLSAFVLKVTIEYKVYVQFVGINMYSNSYWSAHHKSMIKGTSNITIISVNLDENYIGAPSQSHMKTLFELEFRVLPLPSKGGNRRLTPRIFWSLVSSRQRDSILNNRVEDSPNPTRLKVQSSFYQDIVAVIKNKNILNKAPLTGNTQTHPIWVYALRYDFTLHEVTSQANCHSDKPQLVKFAKTRCMRVNVSPQAMSVNGLVKLIVKFKTLNDQLFVRIWSPELPLKMELSDSVLNPIRGLTIPDNKPAQIVNRNFQFDSNQFYQYGRRMSNDADQGARRPSNLSCQQRYQRARITVYSRFTYLEKPIYDNDYFGGSPDAYIDVTESVVQKIQLSKQGERFARIINDRWIEGLRAGAATLFIRRASIISDTVDDPYGVNMQSMAAITVNVTDKPVDIIEIKADLNTELALSPTRLASPSYSISNKRPSLPTETPPMPELSRYQLSLFPSWSGKITSDSAASLTVAMKFSDGTIEPLSKELCDRVGIKVVNLKPQYVDLKAKDSSWVVQRSSVLEPNQQNSGDIIKVTLSSSNECMKAKPLSLRPVIIFASVLPANVHHWSTQPLDEGFTKTKNSPNSPYKPTDNNTLRINESRPQQRRPDSTKVKEIPNNSFSNPSLPKQRFEEPQLPSHNIVDIDREQLMPNAKLHPVSDNSRNENSAAKQSVKSKVDKKGLNSVDDKPQNKNPVSSTRDNQSMSSLKIGMYAILAVFCFAALIFAVNCGAMIARYKRYRTCPRPVNGQQVIATKDNNWVWMGHETLKRNSLHTRCTELLLPTDKFSSSFHQNGATVTPVSPAANHTRFSSGSEAASSQASQGRDGRSDSREENIPLCESTHCNQTGGGSRKGNKQYTGQECSIRILTNPVSDETEDNIAANMVHSYNSNSSQRRKHRRQHGSNGIAPPTGATKSPSSFSDHHPRRGHNRHSPPSFPPPTQPPPPIPANHGRVTGVPPGEDLRSRHARSLCVSKAMTSSNHSSAASSLQHSQHMDEMPPVPPVRTTSRHCPPLLHQPDILLQHHHSKFGLIRPLSQPGAAHMPEILRPHEHHLPISQHIPGANKFSASSMVYAPQTDSSVDTDWQDEIRGMSYDQLMFYFSNLKESTA